ncbi:MAG: YeeE/YedE family protein [Nitrososphaeria archaeon]|nr:YeeE/YedE family protein [Nitrososphaeria archaeon]
MQYLSLTYFLAISFTIGVVFGLIGHSSRFCTMAGIRNLFLFKNKEMFLGIIGMIVGGIIGFTILNFIVPTAFFDFPIFLKTKVFIKASKLLLIVIGCIGLGIISTYADACPFRMHVKAGSGNLNSIIYLLGFYFGLVYFILFLQDLIMSVFFF